MSGASDPDQSLSREESERLEQEHIAKVCRSFQFYKQHALERVQRAERSFSRLPVHHRDMLPDFTARMKDMEAAIETNFSLILDILEGGPFSMEEVLEREPHRALEGDMDKVYTTLKQFVRDWASEGQPERDICYKPIIEKVEGLFAGKEPGFCSQGNEWSMHMLLASNFILNKYPGTFHTVLHPWAHHYSNNYSRSEQLRGVAIPDVDCHDIPEGTDFSMCAGDFLEVYPEADKWDCVTTCFFIDTARNICAYIEQLHRMLKPGGYWINFGPLLYHFDDNRDGPSIELSFQDVKAVAEKVGFTFTEERYPVPCGYISSTHSMMQTLYQCAFTVAQKK